jgi:type IV secretory pathway VirB10-like protein
MSENIIAPTGHKPIGSVPRNLLVGGLLAVTAVAMGIYWFSGDDAAPSTGTQRAQEALKAPDAAAGMVRGNPNSVDEAATAANEAARKRGILAAEAASAPASTPLPFGRPVAGQPLPAAQYPAAASPMGQAPARDSSGQMDVGDAERERSTREAKSIVFDASARAQSTAGGQKAQDGQVDDAAAQLERRAQQLTATMSEPSSAMPDVGQLAQLIKGAGPSVTPTTRPTVDRAWLNEMRDIKAAEALRPVAPAGRYVLRQGRVMPAVLTREILSESSCVVTARSTENVFDANGALLLPSGSEFMGRCNSDVSFGQSRLTAAFTRIILPNGYSYDLPGAEVSDHMGRGGIAGDVDRHFFSSFSSALLLGVLADRVTQATKLPNGSAGTAGGGLSATGQVFVDTARVELERNKGVAPTITVPAGSRINVEVVRDMLFPAPYSAWERN